MNTLFFLFLACGDKDEDTAAEPAGEPSTEASTEPAGEPSGEASSEPAGEASEEPAAEPAGEASSEPASEASEEPAAEPAGEASSEPAAEASEEPPPPAFCDLYAETCGEWTADVACPEWYNAAPATGDTEGAGANQACYDYHLDVAAQQTDQADIDMHCAHAIGGTDAMGAAPCTDAPAEAPAE